MLWIAVSAFSGFACIAGPDVWRYFDLDVMAFDLSRYLRRKWRQNVIRWREILRTNKDWGSK